MAMMEKIKQYFWFMFGIIGVVLFWAGVWEGIGGLPYLENPLISLIAGLGLFAISAVFFKGTNPFWGEKEGEVHMILHQVHSHPQKHEFHIKYHDNIKHSEILYKAIKLKSIEKGFLVFAEKSGKEVFVPVHRVTQILRKGKNFWKL